MWDKKSKGLTTQTFSEWDYNLNDSFWVVAIDEAHRVKQAWLGRKNITELVFVLGEGLLLLEPQLFRILETLLVWQASSC